MSDQLEVQDGHFQCNAGRNLLHFFDGLCCSTDAEQDERLPDWYLYVSCIVTYDTVMICGHWTRLDQDKMAFVSPRTSQYASSSVRSWRVWWLIACLSAHQHIQFMSTKLRSVGTSQFKAWNRVHGAQSSLTLTFLSSTGWCRLNFLFYSFKTLIH